MNYTFLGDGIAAGSSWTFTGANLPSGRNFYIRARGYYRSGISSGSESITESVRNVFLTPTFGNISSRGRVETGDNAMIGGFIITGTQPKTVIHVITIQWKADATPAQIDKAIQGAAALPAQYPGITRVWTKPIKKQLPEGYANIIVMEFASEDALRKYAGSSAFARSIRRVMR